MKKSPTKKEITVRVATPITKEQADKKIEEISKRINEKYSD